MKKVNIKKAAGKAVPLVAGAIGAKLAKNVSGKFIQNDKLRAAVPLVLGIVLAGSKSATMQGIGSGMIAVGGADLVGSFIPGLAGLEDMDLSGIFGEVINGEVINGDDYMNGDGDDDQY